MLRLALMSSENRAASALSRHYPGGREAFIAAMNQKAQALGLGRYPFPGSHRADRRECFEPRAIWPKWSMPPIAIR
jgi:hypothetical protein